MDRLKDPHTCNALGSSVMDAIIFSTQHELLFNVMPSFDAVSKVNRQEVRNAVDQAKRELRIRFDFRGVDAGFELQSDSIVIYAEQDFQVDQRFEIFKAKCVNRDIDVKALQLSDITGSGNTRRQTVSLLEGIDRDSSKSIVKRLKELNKKLQVQTQGNQVRITGKKRDELQEAIASLRELDLPMPLQYKNFRD